MSSPQALPRLLTITLYHIQQYIRKIQHFKHLYIPMFSRQPAAGFAGKIPRCLASTASMACCEACTSTQRPQHQHATKGLALAPQLQTIHHSVLASAICKARLKHSMTQVLQRLLVTLLAPPQAHSSPGWQLHTHAHTSEFNICCNNSWNRTPPTHLRHCTLLAGCTAPPQKRMPRRVAGRGGGTAATTMAP